MDLTSFLHLFFIEKDVTFFICIFFLYSIKTQLCFTGPRLVIHLVLSDTSQSDYLLLLSYPMMIFSANLYRILKQDLVLPRAFSLHFSLLGLLLVCLLLYWVVLGPLLLIIDGRGRRLTSSQNSPALLRRCSNIHLHTYLKAFS